MSYFRSRPVLKYRFGHFFRKIFKKNPGSKESRDRQNRFLLFGCGKCLFLGEVWNDKILLCYRDGKLGSIRKSGFGQNVGNMVFDGSFRNIQPGGDLIVFQSVTDQPQYLDLL